MRGRGIATAVGVIAAFIVAVAGVPAGADSQATNNAPYTCTTQPDLGTQAATYSAIVTDSVDPAQPGQSVTYRFKVPFAQAPQPVAVTYKGGQSFYRIPANLTVTAVSTQNPPGGSPVQSSAAVQGDSVVVTSTANLAVDGSTYPTPDLIVTGTVQPGAAGPGITWKVPYRLIANVDAEFIGPITATCTPNDPNIVIQRTTVPGGPQPPTANDQTIVVTQGSTKAVTLGATDPDTPAGQLTYSIVTPPAQGTLTGTPPAVSYVAGATFVGTDSFVFRVTDPQGGSDTGTVTVRVNPRFVIDNTPPTIAVTSPVNGGVYVPGETVNAAFSCADALIGVKTCSGSTALGGPVPTGTVGQHTFIVNATDEANNPARVTVSYRVISPALVQQTYNAVQPTNPFTANRIPLNCGGLLPLDDEDLPVVVSAPSQVGQGLTLAFRAAVGQQEVPALTTATNLRFTYAVPTNGVAEAATIVPGTGSANTQGSSSVTVTGGKAVLTIAGPIAGGQTAATPYTPPVIDVTIRASAGHNAVVQTRFERFQVTTQIGVLPPQNRNCAGGDAADGEVNPVLTRTTTIDTTPPAAPVIEPGNGDVYLIGDQQAADFACSDNHSVSTCTGTVADGAAVNTASAGIKTFVVDSRDAAGNVAQTFVAYTVKTTTVSYTARLHNGMLPYVDAAAAWLGVTRAQVPRIGVTILAYIAAALEPEGPDPVVPLPPNNGPVAIVTTYPRSQEGAILDLAFAYGLTPDELHYHGTVIAVYYHVLSTA